MVEPDLVGPVAELARVREAIGHSRKSCDFRYADAPGVAELARVREAIGHSRKACDFGFEPTTSATLGRVLWPPHVLRPWDPR